MKDPQINYISKETKLPVGIEPIEKDHPFNKSLQRHDDARTIIEALTRIEACRMYALNQMKKCEPGSDEHSENAASLSVLMERRKVAKAAYHKYLKVAAAELSKI